jgi:recombinational DNA repair ATPase RecF
MIQIESLVIEEFRGVRRLKLDLAKKNFAICGPNGTGKSGVVDALEFALTGSITRLTGQGTSGISVKMHAPHVDQRENPDKSRVVLTAVIASSKKRVVIERYVNSPSTPIISPADPDVLETVRELGEHPEFALSRREIIKYVITPPGERSKEVQALLRLEQIERLRQSLQTVVNSCKADIKRFDEDISQAESQLLRALGVAQLKKEDVLTAVNAKRALLQLEPLTELAKDTSLKTGVALPDAATHGRPLIPKKQVLKDAERLNELLSGLEPTEVKTSRTNVAAILQTLLDSPMLLRNLKRQTFLTTGIELIEDEACPFCDTEWDSQALKSHVDKKLAEAKEATALKTKLEKSAMPLSKGLLELESLLNAVVNYGAQLSPPVGVVSAKKWSVAIGEERKHLTDFANVEKTLAGISECWYQEPKGAREEISEFQKRIEALPDSSVHDEAKECLTISNERLDVYRAAKRNRELSGKRAEVATKVQSAYSATSNAVLTKVYKDVEQDFSRFYRFINREDEATFEGKLTPSLGKLGFDVNFYGRGFFPPGAYHSEGHQDGMGLCLYLALMKHTLGKNFTFAVLDDVLMSVDAGHRREVCGLLKSEFPDTQFIVTTHDPIWLQHMKSEQLLTTKSSVQFRKWTIDSGPVVWDDVGVWQEITKDLDNDDVPGAAGTLRRFLEYVASHLSDRLRARIEFHGDAQYELGELLPAVARAWNELLGRAKESAQSWGKKEEMSQLNDLHDEFKKKLHQSQIEQWSINKSIHYNEWVSLRKPDFIPVVEAFKQLLESLRCPKCGVFLYVTPQKGPMEAIRCDCGSVNFNLKKRTG